VDEGSVRYQVTWNASYNRDWDDLPERYLEHGIVAWGKSRRLGHLEIGRYKAYIGIQHVDPGNSGWEMVESPSARFFGSLFIDGKVVSLRTFSRISEVIHWLAANITGG
jgi:hypothetical protein